MKALFGDVAAYEAQVSPDNMSVTSRLQQPLAQAATLLCDGTADVRYQKFLASITHAVPATPAPQHTATPLLSTGSDSCVLPVRSLQIVLSPGKGYEATLV